MSIQTTNPTANKVVLTHKNDKIMKIIIPMALSLALHFSASAQEHNMPMPKMA